MFKSVRRLFTPILGQLPELLQRELDKTVVNLQEAKAKQEEYHFTVQFYEAREARLRGEIQKLKDKHV